MTFSETESECRPFVFSFPFFFPFPFSLLSFFFIVYVYFLFFIRNCTVWTRICVCLLVRVLSCLEIIFPTTTTTTTTTTTIIITIIIIIIIIIKAEAALVRTLHSGPLGRPGHGLQPIRFLGSFLKK